MSESIWINYALHKGIGKGNKTLNSENIFSAKYFKIMNLNEKLRHACMHACMHAGASLSWKPVANSATGARSRN